jgi:hypothetical protein
VRPLVRWRSARHVVSATRALTNAARRNPDNHSSFFEAHNIIGTPGLGLRRQLDALLGEPRAKIPAFWSPLSDLKAIFGLLTGSWLNMMLVLVPLAFLGKHLGWSATAIFSLVRFVHHL